MVKVSGLSMRFVSRATRYPSRIAGPALYCALGLTVSGVGSQLRITLSTDVAADELAMFADLGIDVSTVAYEPLPSMLLNLDALEAGQPTVHIGNPLAWAYAVPDFVHASEVWAVANGDPQWLMSALAMGRPKFLALDLHLAWIRARRTALRACIEAADLVSGTVEEFKALDQVSIRPRRDCVKLIKDGSGGVAFADSRIVRSLPAPKVSARLACDVGAGDFLLGLIVGEADRSGLTDCPRADGFAEAYARCADSLDLLLSANGPDAFYRAVLRRVGTLN